MHTRYEFTWLIQYSYYTCTTVYICEAYDDYVLGPCRAANAGGPGSQGSALAAASSALRRLHSLQLFLMR